MRERQVRHNGHHDVDDERKQADIQGELRIAQQEPRLALMHGSSPARNAPPLRPAPAHPCTLCGAKGDPHMNVQVNGLIGLLILAADLWAVVSIVQSSASTGKKVLWILLVLILPILGLILWFFLGPRGK
jgi:phospholipase D-like protein